METWEIVGIELNAKFKGDDGTIVPGIRLQLLGDPEAGSSITGRQVRIQFVSNNALSKLNLKPEVGNTITFEFNRYGNICSAKVS